VLPHGSAWFDGHLAEGILDAGDDPGLLDGGGWWAVVITFEGEVRLWRFADVEPTHRPLPSRAWHGPPPDAWRSTLDRAAYVAGVQEVRRRIREGEVYQVNLCRTLSAPVPPDADPWALAELLAAGNPAPYAGVIDVPPVGRLPATRLVCASPELLLGRDGDVVRCDPIKGTGRTDADLQPKDEAENVMIVDLVRNDLLRACLPGSVAVPSLLRVERHPGLVHLVSTVEGRLAPGIGWSRLFDAVLPAGSVSGAPKSSALRAITDLEPQPRGPYCGAIGWVDADRGRARLAVGIRTFWWESALLRFGTGAGITWGSDADQEWEETELKRERLIGLASTPRAKSPARVPVTLRDRR